MRREHNLGIPLDLPPLGEPQLISEPFKRVAMDLIGPIHPTSTRGNRYILTTIDYATRVADAVPLRNMEAETVAEALFSIWCRVGVPTEILTDQGTQFVGRVMEEVNRLLSIKQLTCTPYLPQANGLCEKFNGTLKAPFRKLIADEPKDGSVYSSSPICIQRSTAIFHRILTVRIIIQTYSARTYDDSKGTVDRRRS